MALHWRGTQWILVAKSLRARQGDDERSQAIRAARETMGKTKPFEAAPGTIRGDFALSEQNNLIHGSDSPENAATEVALWFKPEELVSYQPVDSAWIVGG